MKKIFSFLLLVLFPLLLLAQNTPVEPGMETSFDNSELLVVALVGLALLLALYFFFRRRRR
ncbi:MAG: LPXTG cell wall anchor domain-containing protein [Flavisolibacter sp.]